MKQYSCVIWDWNGTLADDVYPSLRSVNDMLLKRSMPIISMEQYFEYIDTPISRFYEHLFDLNVVSMEDITLEFNAGYAKYFEKLHVGVPQLLEELRQAGKRQVILTSGNQRIITGDTEKLGIRAYFDEILGADDLLASGKVQRGINWISGQEIPVSQMVLIGDTLHDFDTARAMGVDCILCAIGHQSRTDLLAAGVPVVDRFTDLKRYLLDEKSEVKNRK